MNKYKVIFIENKWIKSWHKALVFIKFIASPDKEGTLAFNWQKLRQWPIRQPIARSFNLYILIEKHWPPATQTISLVRYPLPLNEGHLHFVFQFWRRALKLLWFCSKNWIIKVSNSLFQTLNSRLSSQVMKLKPFRLSSSFRTIKHLCLQERDSFWSYTRVSLFSKISQILKKYNRKFRISKLGD